MINCEPGNVIVLRAIKISVGTSKIPREIWISGKIGSALIAFFVIECKHKPDHIIFVTGKGDLVLFFGTLLDNEVELVIL